MKITLPTKKELFSLSEDGKKFLFDLKAEEKLVKFLKYVEQVKKLEEELKKWLVEKMKEQGGLLAVEGEKLKITVGKFGGRFKGKNKDFEKEIVVRRLDQELVEKYLHETGELPDGVEEREPSLKIQLKEV